MGKFIDLTGQRFGRLTVIERDTSRPKGSRVYWWCRCDCGNVASVSTKNLRNGMAKSCGCLRHEATNKTHGFTNTKIYQTWLYMRARCCNLKNKRYRNYGGRGIKVCDEWQKDFVAFFDYVSKLEHFGEDGYTLDRINNDGNYEPGNVRWATWIEQANNKSNNHFVEINDVNLTLAQITRLTGAALGTIQDRIRHGWAKEDLLQLPKSKHDRAPRFDVGGGRQLAASEIAEQTGVNLSTVYRRIKSGWTGESLLKPSQK